MCHPMSSSASAVRRRDRFWEPLRPGRHNSLDMQCDLTDAENVGGCMAPAGVLIDCHRFAKGQTAAIQGEL
jgi:hypothetical protein